MKKLTKNAGILSFILMMLFTLEVHSQNQETGEFKVLGLGGAGGMYTPSSSPSEPGLMFVSCDMSGSYRSLDRGKTWQMIHSDELHSSRSCRPTFVNETIYWIQSGQLRYSKDKGEKWFPVAGVPWKNNVTHLACLQGNPAVLFAGAGKGIYVSEDSGTTWQKKSEGTGDTGGLTAAGTKVFAALGNQILLSTDKGKTWADIKAPENQGQKIRGLASGAGKNKELVYSIAGSSGIFRSTDDGGTWVKVLAKGDKTIDGTTVSSDPVDILMPGNQVEIAYACNRHQVFKTEDGGDTWKSVFRMDSYANPGKSELPYNVEKSWVQTELKWGYYITEFGLGINPANPDIAMVSTQGDLYMTTNGGDTWQQLMNEKAGELPEGKGIRYRSTGLEVTSSWNFYFDPFDNNRYYIAYTDVGFARSIDKGETWIHAASGSGNWGNTFYNIAFDPEIKGKMYASASNRHDIPHWTHINANSPQHEGGVIMSMDHGASWGRINNGLPHAPCTWVSIDLSTPKENRTLYAAMFGAGVYKSVDNGKSWVQKSKGLGNEGNMHVLQVQIHPVTGNLFAGITANRVDNQFPVAGGLWKSVDGGENWTNLTGSLNLKWPTYFTFHPGNENIIYLSAATAPGASQGGLYKTTDGGKTWQRILSDADFAKKCSPSYVQASAVKLHPSNPDYVYLGSSHGLWVSTNAGENWQWFTGIPFRSAQNIAFDPENPELMYVNTFGGGVWKGYYLPVPGILSK